MFRVNAIMKTGVLDVSFRKEWSVNTRINPQHFDTRIGNNENGATAPTHNAHFWPHTATYTPPSPHCRIVIRSTQ